MKAVVRGGARRRLHHALSGGAVAVTAFAGDQQLRCYQLRDSRSRTITVADAGAPLTKPKNGPKSLVAEKPVT
jgi:hypothetical protein